MGFLFYGDPGCGKTSCIKALANYTKCNVVEINLKNIKTCSEFISQFQNEYYDDIFIPSNKKIIVIEDIDCMSDVIKSRKKKEIKSKKNKENKENKENEDNKDNKENEEDKDKENEDNNNQYCIINTIKNNNETNTETNKNKLNDSDSDDSCYKSNKKNSYYNDDTLTLSCILNTIDGVYEQYGRIMIITTNFIDYLDEALIRPGRIDVKVNFTKCSKKMCYDIIEHFYNQKIKDDINFPENKYSPADLLEKCFLHNDDMDSLIKEITK